ncbi:MULTISPECIES: serine hydrolase [unclassified Paenibacillus]|uniref:D-alanyl-D-alanine carboxypeptidase family protein n=1 Tax=Paenibacillus provencensis TaxID=441151 RepID=A0ABW3PUD0_9BACL|nr:MULTISPECIES: serine hydrolase [unclassified Paenibacillus]MCM3129874.1 serine hydrolase [Paenibacillus sp. MER 78]SFS91293.1 D-alanyl-D-alanine carboxypeptidase (penicillin-binding protein 5/6) [Paenibacillus sp. 453mf]
MSNTKKKKKRFSIKGMILLLITILLLADLEDVLQQLDRASDRWFQHTRKTSDPIVPYELYSSNAKLVRLADDEALFAVNSEEKIYPASLTKIMTAILAIESLSNLEQTVRLDAELFPPLVSEGASMAGFLPHEDVKAIDLLYGTLLPSGAEASVALAQFVSSTEEQFVVQMNKKAAELGMRNTHFTNPTGLHDEEHYSTIDDLTILLKYALHNEQFKEIFTTTRYSTSASSLHPEGITIYSTLADQSDSMELANGEIKGGKTGYTERAGLCLATYADIDGEEYILITAGADGNANSEPFHLLDAIQIYNLI